MGARAQLVRVQARGQRRVLHADEPAQAARDLLRQGRAEVDRRLLPHVLVRRADGPRRADRVHDGPDQHRQGTPPLSSLVARLLSSLVSRLSSLVSCLSSAPRDGTRPRAEGAPLDHSARRSRRHRLSTDREASVKRTHRGRPTYARRCGAVVVSSSRKALFDPEEWDEREVRETVEADWVRENGMADALSHDKFQKSLFELVDTWSSTIKLVECVRGATTCQVSRRTIVRNPSRATNGDVASRVKSVRTSSVASRVALRVPRSCRVKNRRAIEITTTTRVFSPPHRPTRAATRPPS